MEVKNILFPFFDGLFFCPNVNLNLNVVKKELSKALEDRPFPKMEDNLKK